MNNYEKLIDPPMSKKVFEALEQKVFARSFNNLSTTIVAFPGSGKASEIKFLIRNVDKLEGYKKQVFLILDIDSLYENEDLAIKEALLSVANGFKNALSEESYVLVENLLKQEKLNTSDLLKVVSQITISQNSYLCIFLENFGSCLSETREKNRILESLKNTSPMRTSFVILCSEEFDKSSLEKLGNFDTTFLSEIVWLESLIFDKDSFERLIRNQEIWHNHKFGSDFKQKVWELCSFDPSLAKNLVTQALGSSAFEKRLIEILEVEELLDIDILKNHLTKIISVLKSHSMGFLKGENVEPSEYLLKTGLITMDGKYINPIFKAFVDKNKESFGSGAHIAKGSLKERLTGQELLLLNFLESKNSVLATRDEVSQALWTNRWEEDQSDWAIDKTVSRLRQKLIQAGYKKSLKTIKGKGFILS